MGLSAKERAENEAKKKQEEDEKAKQQKAKQKEVRAKEKDALCDALIEKFYEEMDKHTPIEDNIRIQVSVKNIHCSWSYPIACKLLDRHIGPRWQTIANQKTKHPFDTATSEGLMIVMIFESTIDEISLDMYTVNVFSIMKDVYHVDFNIGWSAWNGCNENNRLLFNLWRPHIPVTDLPLYRGWAIYLWNQRPKGIRYIHRKYKTVRWEWVYSLRECDKYADEGDKGFYCPINILQ